MHDSVRKWVELQVDQFELSKKETLEVGSYDVNGGVRDLFKGNYLGIDMRDGPGVDKVFDMESRPTRYKYEVIVCLEVLEHAMRPWIVIKNMADSLLPGGHLIITARGYDKRGCFKVHDHPHDYWRFSTESMGIMIEDAGMASLIIMPDPEEPGVFLMGIK